MAPSVPGICAKALDSFLRRLTNPCKSLPSALFHQQVIYGGCSDGAICAWDLRQGTGHLGNHNSFPHSASSSLQQSLQKSLPEGESRRHGASNHHQLLSQTLPSRDVSSKQLTLAAAAAAAAAAGEAEATAATAAAVAAASEASQGSFKKGSALVGAQANGSSGRSGKGNGGLSFGGNGGGSGGESEGISGAVEWASGVTERDGRRLVEEGLLAEVERDIDKDVGVSGCAEMDLLRGAFSDRLERRFMGFQKKGAASVGKAYQMLVSDTLQQAGTISSAVQHLSFDPASASRLSFHLNNGWSGVLHVPSLSLSHIHCPPPPWVNTQPEVEEDERLYEYDHPQHQHQQQRTVVAPPVVDSWTWSLVSRRVPAWLPQSVLCVPSARDSHLFFLDLGSGSPHATPSSSESNHGMTISKARGNNGTSRSPYIGAVTSSVVAVAAAPNSLDVIASTI
ncbi:unnamed protein product, partial [Closterium sp. Naga37s-1]